MGEINLDDFKPTQETPVDGDVMSRILRQSKPMMPGSTVPKFDSSADRAMLELDKTVSAMRKEAEELLKKGRIDEAQRKIKEAHDLYERGKGEILG